MRFVRAFMRFGEGWRMRLRDGGGDVGTASTTFDGPGCRPPLEHAFSPVAVELTFSLRGVSGLMASIGGGEPGPSGLVNTGTDDVGWAGATG